MNPLSPAWWEARDGEPFDNDERRNLERVGQWWLIVGLVILVVIASFLEPHLGTTAGL